MDKLMSGFGLSQYFKSPTENKGVGASNAAAVSSSSVSSSSATPKLDSIPTPKPSDTRLPNQPAKVARYFLFNCFKFL